MFRRIANLFRGFLGLFVSGMEKRNPEALLEVEKENLREQIAQYNQGLAAHAGLCERLITQVKKRRGREEQDLRARVGANLRAGNKELAGQLALQLQQVTRRAGEQPRAGRAGRRDVQEPGRRATSRSTPPARRSSSSSSASAT